MGENTINWEDKPEGEKQPAPAVGASDLNQTQENMNLSKEQMKEVIRKVKEEYPDDLLQPLILKGVTAKANRFYVLRAITLEDMGEIEDLMATFEEEELKSVKASARKEFIRGRAKDNKPVDEDNLTEDQANELRAFVDDYVKGNIGAITKRVNELVVNVLGVRFPKDHAKKVASRKIPYGDVVMVSSAAQVFSGWSEVEMDVEAYSDNQIEELYEGIQ